MKTTYLVTLDTDEALTREQQIKMGRWVARAIKTLADKDDAANAAAGTMTGDGKATLDVIDLHISLASPVYPIVDGPA